MGWSGERFAGSGPLFRLRAEGMLEGWADAGIRGSLGPSPPAHDWARRGPEAAGVRARGLRADPLNPWSCHFKVAGADPNGMQPTASQELR